MAPVKFDDIPKTASEVLGDDYQVAGYSLKTKQKTNFDGAVFSGAVDIADAKDGIWTPAKLTWKFPKPLGTTFFSVDKLEMDKKGKLKLEATTEKVYDKLKVVMGSDLADPAKVTVSCTYTGIKDTQLKLDTKAMQPKDFTFEATHQMGIATVGLKCAKATITSPDIGLRVAQGDLFCSILAKEKFKVFQAHAFYKALPALKMACTYTYGGKANGSYCFGIGYDVIKGGKLKAKVAQDKTVSASVKYDIAKGFTVLAGGKYDIKSKDYSYGLQISIE